MKENILITGSSGFIGKELKKKLFEKGYNTLDFNSANGDIAKTTIDFKNINHVFHLAGKSFVPESWTNPQEFYRVNFSGTLNVLEFCRKTGASLTFVSSYVYGIPEQLPINENHIIKPANPYAHSKVMAENVCLYYQENFKIRITIVRPFNIYGANQNEQFLISKIINQVFDESQKEIKLFDLSPKRDYLYLDDFITAILLLFEKQQTGIYNVGSGYSMRVDEIANKIMAVAGIQKQIVSNDEVRKNEIPDVVADISKIKLATGWEPQFSFEKGIYEIVKAIVPS